MINAISDDDYVFRCQQLTEENEELRREIEQLTDRITALEIYENEYQETADRERELEEKNADLLSDNSGLFQEVDELHERISELEETNSSAVSILSSIVFTLIEKRSESPAFIKVLDDLGLDSRQSMHNFLISVTNDETKKALDYLCEILPVSRSKIENLHLLSP